MEKRYVPGSQQASLEYGYQQSFTIPESSCELEESVLSIERPNLDDWEPQEEIRVPPSLRDPRIHVTRQGLPLSGFLEEADGAGWIDKSDGEAALSDAAFADSVRRWWEWIPRKKEWMIDDSSFAWLYVILYTTILPDISASSGHDGIIKAAQNDWEASGAGLGMGFTAFAGYMKGLANNFTLGSETQDYVVFLETLLGSAKLLAGEKPVWVGPEEGRMGRGNDDWLDQLTVFNYTKRASAVLHSKKKTYQKVKQGLSKNKDGDLHMPLGTSRFTSMQLFQTIHQAQGAKHGVSKSWNEEDEARVLEMMGKATPSEPDPEPQDVEGDGGRGSALGIRSLCGSEDLEGPVGTRRIVGRSEAAAAAANSAVDHAPAPASAATDGIDSTTGEKRLGPLHSRRPLSASQRRLHLSRCWSAAAQRNPRMEWRETDGRRPGLPARPHSALDVRAAGQTYSLEETAGGGTAAGVENQREGLNFGRFGIEWVGRGRPVVVPGVGGIVMFENGGSSKGSSTRPHSAHPGDATEREGLHLGIRRKSSTIDGFSDLGRLGSSSSVSSDAHSISSVAMRHTIQQRDSEFAMVPQPGAPRSFQGDAGGGGGFVGQELTPWGDSFSDDEEKERDGRGNRTVGKNGGHNVLRSSASKHTSSSHSPTAGPRSQSPDLRQVSSPSNKTRSPRASSTSYSTHAAPTSKSWAPATRPSTAKSKPISMSVGIAQADAAPATGHLRPASAIASSRSAYAPYEGAASSRPQSEIAARELGASWQADSIRSVEWQGEVMSSKREPGRRQQRPQSAVRRAPPLSEPQIDVKAEQQRSVADAQFADVFRIQAAPPQQLIAYNTHREPLRPAPSGRKFVSKGGHRPTSAPPPPSSRPFSAGSRPQYRKRPTSGLSRGWGATQVPVIQDW